jgi:hypothetical protein
VRGIKNFYDPSKISMQDVGTLDFIRGEEAQVAGLLENREVKLPTIITINSKSRNTSKRKYNTLSV